ncbi:MAG: hypothetical protein E6559_17540, partial [Pantoea sp.]|nr:hypothetical protein [Pantoea sp.]
AKKAEAAQAAAGTPTEEVQPVDDVPPVDPRKAAVEAAIARAKAKKAAAAIARAKARKAQPPSTFEE